MVRLITLFQNLADFQPLVPPGEPQGAFMEAGTGIGGYLAAHEILVFSWRFSVFG
jgi:hypothetical protein